jgi:hypothetical protein
VRTAGPFDETPADRNRSLARQAAEFSEPERASHPHSEGTFPKVRIGVRSLTPWHPIERLRHYSLRYAAGIEALFCLSWRARRHSRLED